MTGDIIQQANEELSKIEEEPRSLEEFLSFVEDNPQSISQSVKYVLDAIESCGTRTVIEGGEEKERYCFFDDPYGDGEHAVLGNTDELNDFVEQLRRMASPEGENNKIIWFKGPTATGKSELKRCLVNGMRGYSKTEEGRRYTVEWNFDDDKSGHIGMSYGDMAESEGEWYRSPVNASPISILPEQTRKRFIDSVNKDSGEAVKSVSDLDPFSREVLNSLKSRYSENSVENLFEKISSENHVRIVRYLIGLGNGIGVLHAEDGGSEKERLVGSWMPQMMKQFQSRGRKNPQAFAYDGVLSQGNGVLTVVEDAAHHVDIIQKLLNIPEERMVKLDKKITMDIDTLLVLISNPDLEQNIKQYTDRGQGDPLRALRRRLDRYDLEYLTSVSLETQLLRRLLRHDYDVWTETGEDALDRVREPVELYRCQFSPHSIEAAAMYDVVTRLDKSMLEEYNVVEKAIALEKGFIESNNEKISIENLSLKSDMEGTDGVPVTYTVDVLTELAQDNDIVMAYDVVESISDGFSQSPIFSSKESGHYQNYSVDVSRYIFSEMEKDILDAMVGDIEATEEEISEYIDSIFEWEDSNNDDGEDEEFDPYKLREFEIEFLGASEGGYTDNAIPKKTLKEFRKEYIINPVNSYIYSNKGEDFEVDEVALRECPVISSLLGDNDWNSVKRHYPNADFSQWRNAPSGSETEELKEKTLSRMVDNLGYTEEGANRASTKIIEIREGIE